MASDFLKRFQLRHGSLPGYDPIPDSSSPSDLRPLYLSNVKQSSLRASSSSLVASEPKTRKRSALNLLVIGLALAGIVYWVISILYWESSPFVPLKSESPPFVRPGDALWLCYDDNHSSKSSVCAPGDGTPDSQDYFPIVYVIIADDGKAIARAIVNETTPCPDITYQGKEMVDQPLPKVAERAVGKDHLPYAFPIRVCEAYIERNQTNLHFGNRKIPAVPSNPSKYVVIGDTGLRSKPVNLGLGTCTDGPLMYGVHQCLQNFTKGDINASAFDGHFQSIDDWPLKTLMRKAVEEQPDVLIHMGDFIYRQGPCPYPNGNDAQCSGINLPERYSWNGSNVDGEIMNFIPGSFGDTFQSWWADFFYPSLEALSEVPWIALRGNHESCSRAGRGWFLFLSPELYKSDAVGGSHCDDYTEPRQIKFENEQFVILDDSAIEPKDHGFDGLAFVKGDCPTEIGSDLPAPVIMNRFHATNPEQECDDIYEQLDIFTEYYERVEAMTVEYDKSSFYLGHRPIFGVACNDTKLLSMDWTLQCALSCTTLDRFQALYSGHMHWRETIIFEDDRLPPQIIVGHGGTDLVSNYIIDRSLDGLRLEVGQDSMIAATIDRGDPDSTSYGYAVMERNASTKDYSVVFRGIDVSTGKMRSINDSLLILKGPTRKPDAASTCHKKADSFACSPPKNHKCSR